MSDFLDLQGAKDLNTDAIHIGAVANSKNPVTGAPIDTHVNRVGGTDYTLKGLFGALSPVVMPWTSVAGGTLTQPNQAFLHPANGNYYSWGGAFPKVVAPGTNPAAITGYVPRTDVVLRDELAAPGGTNLIGFTGEATLTDELTKNRHNESFVVDTFFRYCKTPSACRPVLIIGDSITEGSNSTDWKSDNYASIIRKAVQNKYSNRNFGFANFDFTIYEAHPSSTKYPHNCIRAGFYGIEPFQGGLFGATAVKATATTGQYIEVSYLGKNARLVYLKDPAGGVVSVSLNGTVVGSVDTRNDGSADFLPLNSAYGMIGDEIFASSFDNNVLRFTVQSGLPTLIGVVYQEDVSNDAPTIFNLGRSSLTLSEIPDGLLQVYGNSTGATVLALGVNDKLTSASIDTYKAKLETFLSSASNAKGTCVLADFIFNAAASDTYKTAMREAAAKYKFPYLDFGSMWLSAESQNKFLGYLDADGVHPTDAGHEFIANEIMRVIGLPYTKGSAVGYSPAVSQTAINLSSPWVNFGVGYAGASYSMSDSGIVLLTGMMSTPSSVSAYGAIGTLPLHCRPSANIILVANSNHGFIEIEVRKDGVIQLGSAGVSPGNFLSISGISFQSALF